MADGKSLTSSASSRAGCARSGLLALGSILVVVYLFTRAGNGGGDDHHPTPTTEPLVTTTLAVPGDAVAPACPAEDGSSKPTRRFTTAPPMCIDVNATYVATVKTNRGDFAITLRPADAPKAVNSFVFLARWHYYDGVGFSRVLKDYLVQVGDPVNSDFAGGDAGYLLPEEPPKQAPFYPEGSVVMANQPPKPNTTGSEFFVITGSGPQVEQLTPSFSRIGTVTSGQNVVDAIDATGRKNDDIGAPQDLTVVDSITVEQTG